MILVHPKSTLMCKGKLGHMSKKSCKGEGQERFFEEVGHGSYNARNNVMGLVQEGNLGYGMYVLQQCACCMEFCIMLWVNTSGVGRCGQITGALGEMYLKSTILW